MSISNSTFTADPAGHAMADAERWSITDADQGVGVFAKALTEVRLENVSVSGFNPAASPRTMTPSPQRFH